MSTKNETVAILIENSNMEVRRNVNPLQYALLGLGYEWARTAESNNVILNFNNGSKDLTILLNVKNKILTWDDGVFQKKNAYECRRLTESNLTEIVEFCEAPPSPKNELIVEDNGVKFIADLEENTVKIILFKGDTAKITLETLRRLTASMTPKTEHPIVAFWYPDSKTGDAKRRIVNVTDYSPRYLCGYEIREDLLRLNHLYKKFSVSKMTSDVMFLPKDEVTGKVVFL
jgi:hypothetical protein